MLDHAKVVDLIKVAKTVDFTTVLADIERCEKNHGHVHFEDIIKSLARMIDPIKTPHLFEACKRYLETIVTVTIHDDPIAVGW